MCINTLKKCIALRNLLVKINSADKSPSDVMLDEVFRIPVADVILDEICKDIANAVRNIIPDFEYYIEYDDFNTIHLYSKSHHTEDSEHHIPLDTAIYNAIPEEHRSLFIFQSDGYYVSKEEANKIQLAIKNLFKEV